MKSIAQLGAAVANIDGRMEALAAAVRKHLNIGKWYSVSCSMGRVIDAEEKQAQSCIEIQIVVVCTDDGDWCCYYIKVDIATGGIVAGTYHSSGGTDPDDRSIAGDTLAGLNLAMNETL